MREIVDTTGLSKGAFYHYFESKESVFEEVIKYFYDQIMITDYSEFPETSLKAFYNTYLSRLDNSPVELKTMADQVNPIVFISEAIRKFPIFLNIHNNQRAKELKAWSNIVAIAKKNKEIYSDMPDEDIASLFLNISDGIALNRNVTMKGDSESYQAMKKDWDNLYELLIKK